MVELGNFGHLQVLIRPSDFYVQYNVGKPLRRRIEWYRFHNDQGSGSNVITRINYPDLGWTRYEFDYGAHFNVKISTL